MIKRVLVAGLFHETHTFLPGFTGLDAFDLRRGRELLEVEGDASPLGGVLEVARVARWAVLPAVDLRAMPSATVADEVIELFWQILASTAEQEQRHGIDGIYLVLHGAMVSRSLRDVEGEVLRRVRGLNGLASVPLCGVLDLHANVTPAMARHGTAFLAYRENPHTDAREAAMDAAWLLDRLMRTGERPVTVWEHPPLLWPPTGTGTRAEPMRTLQQQARAIEAANPPVLAVNVFGGFSFADTAESGISFTAVTLGDPRAARAALRRLGAYALAHRAEGVVLGLPLPDVMRRLVDHNHGPVLLVEPADNIGGGAPGDLTHVLRALIQHGIRDGGVIINDPEAVQAVWGQSVGDRVRLAIGGKSGVIGAEPLPLEVEVVSRSDGRFRIEDRHSHLASAFGAQIDMGPCAVVRAGGVLILLTTRKTPPFDLAQWRSQGIAPERLFVIGVKAAVAHRQAYDPIAAASYLLDSPGPCASDLRSLPFRYVERPVYPLDEL
jgi:microcystin degradation protein MlrC